MIEGLDVFISKISAPLDIFIYLLLPPPAGGSDGSLMMGSSRFSTASLMSPPYLYVLPTYSAFVVFTNTSDCLSSRKCSPLCHHISLQTLCVLAPCFFGLDLQTERVAFPTALCLLLFLLSWSSAPTAIIGSCVTGPHSFSFIVMLNPQV